MKIVVVGGGSWGTAFSRLLADRGHDVTLACRDPEQARAISETGRNPRYLGIVDLRGIPAAPLAEAPVAQADVVVVALPSRAFASVVAALPGTAPILSLTKGLDPGTGERLSTLVVLSKWDVSQIRIEEIRPQLERRLRQRPPLIAVSAHSGRGVGRLLDEVERLFERYAGRIATAELNRALRELREARQPPSRNGKRLNLLYGAQVRTRPPRFRIHVSDPRLVTRDYGYWVENRLRERFDLPGVPLSIDFVRRS